MLLIILCLTLGAALSFIVPTGVAPGTKYRAPTEEDFQKLLKRRGLK